MDNCSMQQICSDCDVTVTLSCSCHARPRYIKAVTDPTLLTVPRASPWSAPSSSSSAFWSQLPLGATTLSRQSKAIFVNIHKVKLIHIKTCRVQKSDTVCTQLQLWLIREPLTFSMTNHKARSGAEYIVWFLQAEKLKCVLKKVRYIRRHQ